MDILLNIRESKLDISLLLARFKIKIYSHVRNMHVSLVVLR